jgi:hypothetical protein
MGKMILQRQMNLQFMHRETIWCTSRHHGVDGGYYESNRLCGDEENLSFDKEVGFL